MGWLQEHLENFVKPVLGYIPELPKNHKPYFTTVERVVIKNIWRATKQEAARLNRPILLAGRDAFVWEILARREGYPTVFRPDISSVTASQIKEDYSGYFLLDTGYSGSIPKKLKCEFYLGASNAVPDASGYASTTLQNVRKEYLTKPVIGEAKHQAFPRMRDARSIMCKVETSPKYWTRALYRKPGPQTEWETAEYVATFDANGFQQQFSHKDEFLGAALLTLEIYKDSSPTFIDRQLIIRVKPAPIKKKLTTVVDTLAEAIPPEGYGYVPGDNKYVPVKVRVWHAAGYDTWITVCGCGTCKGENLPYGYRKY